jgi:hypothetical protein
MDLRLSPMSFSNKFTGFTDTANLLADHKRCGRSLALLRRDV